MEAATVHRLAGRERVMLDVRGDVAEVMVSLRRALDDEGYARRLLDWYAEGVNVRRPRTPREMQPVVGDLLKLIVEDRAIAHIAAGGSLL